MKHRRQLLGAMAAGTLAGPLGALLGSKAHAQASGSAAGFPSKPITMVVPAPPGGSTDTLARVLADEFSKRLGQPVIIENKPGASGMIGTQAVARAAPDGYTLLFAFSTPIYYVQHLFTKVPYDVGRDLAFITEICGGTAVLAVGSQVPATNMKEFLAWAERNRGKVAYGSYGVGSYGHLVSEYLNKSRNLEMTHVAYKGEAPLVQDLVGGQVAWGVASSGGIAPHVASGRLRALAVMGTQRIAAMPDVPTMVEAGIPDRELYPVGMLPLMAPAGVPAPILARLEKEARDIVHNVPAMKTRLQFAGMYGIGGSAEAARRNWEESAPQIKKLVQVSGIPVE